MGAMGIFAGYPLLQFHALSLAGIITLYTVAALAARTTMRWRSTKQLYQQLLLSYQHSNRVGSSEGALLCVSATHLQGSRQRAAQTGHLDPSHMRAPAPARELPPAIPPLRAISRTCDCASARLLGLPRRR